MEPHPAPPHPPRRRLRRILRALGLLVVLIAIALGAAWWAARPASPDAFYTPPDGLPLQPGSLLRAEPFTRGVPPGARAWRILYTTTRRAGEAAVASALVVVARDAPAGPRPVVAWTHGTTGVARGCAPTLLDDPFANVPALRELLAEGWLFLATDYVGLGTPGPHPYLIGDGQARSALDAVRAVRGFTEVTADARTVVWGHSQGGHAALWTGILAPDYAPDAQVIGVAAVAPASDLPALIDPVQHTVVGRIMTAYLLAAYVAHYPEVTYDAWVPASRRLLAKDLAGRCLAGREALFSVAEALALGGTLFGRNPTHGALGDRLRENVPARPIAAPVFVAQGLSDDLVLPAVQAAFVEARCADGQTLAYRTYPGRDHLSIVAPDSPYVADLVAWTRERFAAKPAPAECRLSTHRPR